MVAMAPLQSRSQGFQSQGQGYQNQGRSKSPRKSFDRRDSPSPPRPVARHGTSVRASGRRTGSPIPASAVKKLIVPEGVNVSSSAECNRDSERLRGRASCGTENPPTSLVEKRHLDNDAFLSAGAEEFLEESSERLAMQTGKCLLVHMQLQKLLASECPASAEEDQKLFQSLLEGLPSESEPLKSTMSARMQSEPQDGFATAERRDRLQFEVAAESAEVEKLRHEIRLCRSTSQQFAEAVEAGCQAELQRLAKLASSLEARLAKRFEALGYPPKSLGFSAAGSSSRRAASSSIRSPVRFQVASPRQASAPSGVVKIVSSPTRPAAVRSHSGSPPSPSPSSPTPYQALVHNAGVWGASTPSTARPHPQAQQAYAMIPGTLPSGTGMSIPVSFAPRQPSVSHSPPRHTQKQKTQIPSRVVAVEPHSSTPLTVSTSRVPSTQRSIAVPQGGQPQAGLLRIAVSAAQAAQTAAAAHSLQCLEDARHRAQNDFWSA
eukprot:TRINITY_DN22571_c0_g1_i1.p1 TRINITY_DN22571_c0_g1~~TRINITY_DN22571_c0_g1_i1.p1  ORF type:complete len:491 (-),score=94.73 TRINITY_DN22571_c0_g1_i1:20-1492(-)